MHLKFTKVPEIGCCSYYSPHTSLWNNCPEIHSESRISLLRCISSLDSIVFYSLNPMTVLTSIHLIVLFCLIWFTCLFGCVVSDSVNVLTVFCSDQLILWLCCIRFVWFFIVSYSMQLLIWPCCIRFSYSFDSVLFESVNILPVLYWIKLIFWQCCIRLIKTFDGVVFDSVKLLTVLYSIYLIFWLCYNRFG